MHERNTLLSSRMQIVHSVRISFGSQNARVRARSMSALIASIIFTNVTKFVANAHKAREDHERRKQQQHRERKNRITFSCHFSFWHVRRNTLYNFVGHFSLVCVVVFFRELFVRSGDRQAQRETFIAHLHRVCLQPSDSCVICSIRGRAYRQPPPTLCVAYGLVQCNSLVARHDDRREWRMHATAGHALGKWKRLKHSTTNAIRTLTSGCKLKATILRGMHAHRMQNAMDSICAVQLRGCPINYAQRCSLSSFFASLHVLFFRYFVCEAGCRMTLFYSD